MTANQLRAVISGPEGLKLDFKREYKLSPDPPSGTEAKLWKTFVKGQWEELMRDLLSLANGNIGTCRQPGRLIIGVDDVVGPNGSRLLFDTSKLHLTVAQILERLNCTCSPPLCDIQIERIPIDDKVITVITIPPTPYMHETTRQLRTSKGEFDAMGRLRFCKDDKSYSEHTVFLRRGDGIYPAQFSERQALAREKEIVSHQSIHHHQLPQHMDQVATADAGGDIRPGAKALSVAGVAEVLDWGWDGIKLLEEFIALDYATLDALLPSHEGSPEQWAPVFMNHPDTWRMLISGPGEIRGYWHFAPLFSDDYERAKAGQLLDSEITADRIRLFELPGRYELYFVQLCLHPRYRHPIHVRLLFRSILDLFKELTEQGVFVREICANAYTDMGRSICRSLELTRLGNHAEHGIIYAGAMSDILKSSFGTLTPTLAKLYGDADLL